MNNIISLHDYESYGPEIVLNGKFVSDFRNWSGTNWRWGSSGAAHTAGSTAALVQSSAVVVAEDIYVLEFSILQKNLGSVAVFIGGVTTRCDKNSNNKIMFKALSSSPSAALAFVPTSDFDGIIDSVSLKRVIGGTFFINDTIIFNSPISFKFPDGTTGASLTPIEDTFTDADLVAGILTYEHNLGKKYVSVVIFDDADKVVIPDEVIPQDINSVNVDLSGLTVTGTWTIRVSK
jgi:hypothetical protein